jgi:carbon-monoxide dehydrogenase iron sulfur subunit
MRVKRIYCRIEKCLACRACEIACAVAHSESGNLMDAVREETTPKHRINVRVFESGGRSPLTRAIAIQCRHCIDPPCAEACPEQCIQRDEKTGEVFIDQGSCTGCWVCVKVCPYGAIIRHRGLRTALICDHCPDRKIPACVGACRTGALVYCEREEIETDYAEELRR